MSALCRIPMTSSSNGSGRCGVVETLRSFVQMYGSANFETPDGIKLRLYGLGEHLELSEEARSRLATLGAELAPAVWREGEL